MSHDKISAAARRRMAETGEPYAAARRAVVREHQAGQHQAGQHQAGEHQAGEHQAAGSQPTAAEWFALSFRNRGLDKFNIWLDRGLFGGGPGRAGVEVDADAIRVRGVADFRLDIPRASVRSVARSPYRTRGTSGVHEVSRGLWLVNGSSDGLVELVIDPPLYTGRTLSTGFMKRRMNSLILGLADPDGFVAAVQRDGGHSRAGVGRE
jgi:hypothetical protein